MAVKGECQFSREDWGDREFPQKMIFWLGFEGNIQKLDQGGGKTFEAVDQKYKDSEL